MITSEILTVHMHLKGQYSERHNTQTAYIRVAKEVIKGGAEYCFPNTAHTHNLSLAKLSPHKVVPA